VLPTKCWSEYDGGVAHACWLNKLLFVGGKSNQSVTSMLCAKKSRTMLPVSGIEATTLRWELEVNGSSAWIARPMVDFLGLWKDGMTQLIFGPNLPIAILCTAIN